MKILLVQSKDLIGGTGGTEKMCCFYANTFVEMGHDVEIATMEDIEGDKPHFYLDNRVKVKKLFTEGLTQLDLKPLINYKGKNPMKWIYYKYKKKQAKFYNRNLLKKLGDEGIFKYILRNCSEAWNKYINEISPDVIIANGLDFLLDITYYRWDYDIPIVVSVHVSPEYFSTDKYWEWPEFLPEILQNAYRYANVCSVLLSSYKELLPKTFGGQVFAIPNPVDQIDPTKLANKYPKWDLHFWGIGKDELILREKIAKLGLSDRIFLKGFTDNPIEKLKESDIFVFPSKYEGFPLALTEAMSVGLPSVGFEYCCGVNELIEHDKNGFLAKDENEMQEYLERLMKDSILRNKLGKQANKDMQKYSPDIVAKKWDELLNTAVGK